jgi:hypothetical protein
VCWADNPRAREWFQSRMWRLYTDGERAQRKSPAGQAGL